MSIMLSRFSFVLGMTATINPGQIATFKQFSIYFASHIPCSRNYLFYMESGFLIFMPW